MYQSKGVLTTIASSVDYILSPRAMPTVSTGSSEPMPSGLQGSRHKQSAGSSLLRYTACSTKT